MATEMKEWTKPQLIVLVRNRPEEAVLTACKDAAGGAYASDDGGCSFGSIGDCGYCEGMGGS